MPGKVLVANRGEIAVRIIRACQDAGISTVAVYAAPDRDALHVRAADEAHSLGGDTPATSYLDMAKVLAVAARSGADAVHPGYGFLSENADFAQAVLDAGLTWVGPPPQAIRDLGDKVAARSIAQRVGAPLVAGTPGPVSGVEEIQAFADRHGLPIAIKAAFGGGGRGLKVARAREEIPELYESAVREATAAFGNGACFVERYLERPRHVETQCLTDTHGNVVVVSTRDCSLQRRHQKLVEEAPAPFLTDQQDAEIRAASKAIMREAGYVGAGTCEFLVGADGALSFLEVNTRLQVEHPVTEEVTGIDLVLEMLRIADGEEIGYDDPVARGHSIEFRINGEDPGKGFLPTPGTVAAFVPPTGPGVRVDTGVESGSVVGAAWDSLLAKLIVTGATREQALGRARRALAEFHVDGIATVLPFHRAIVMEPAFVGSSFAVHTRWIETEFSAELSPFTPPSTGTVPESLWETVVVEVEGRRLEIAVPGPSTAPGNRMKRRANPQSRSAVSGDTLSSPMQGAIVKIAVRDGQHVEEGELVVMLEAMKMEQPLNAPRSGTVRGIKVDVGDTVASGAVICEIKE
ncbi:acetyl/propionyl/methylcrotonyl-CoA carboxylase subunit alpha [Nocardiopsis ansamitocini]|uniref:biotin carboxylase n=1 Tax=Nocardiopsis ansamitocini TaxID=1670832 RepID=A0A9W6UK31_9ACTN|nr:biotin carboxylase N-terminal domain-containing protein [Nocardiopsis ansamitocini]GLU48665.1 acetyl-/propionyl-CoA carboxylase subunit alpha [Nocardiopsis ansamitocini]